MAKVNFRTDDENRSFSPDQPEIAELSSPPTHAQVTEWFYDPAARGKIIDVRNWRLIGRPDVACGKFLTLLCGIVEDDGIANTLDFEEMNSEVVLRYETGATASELCVRRAYLIVGHDLSAPPDPLFVNNKSIVFVAKDGRLVHAAEHAVSAKFRSLLRTYNVEEDVGYSGYLGSEIYHSGPDYDVNGV